VKIKKAYLKVTLFEEKKFYLIPTPPDPLKGRLRSGMVPIPGINSFGMIL
jgi:hypothetical protein